MCEVIGIVRDEMTPKIDEGGVSFTLRSRDYKGVMAVVISKDNRAADGTLGELRWPGRIQRYVRDGEEEQ